jgi:hypothetical protein
MSGNADVEQGTESFRREKSSSAEGYDYMFPGLPPLELDDARAIALAREIARPVQAIENANVPAGYTYFAQLMAHDLTRMRGRQNMSVPGLWLDTVYGHPPENGQHSYERNREGDRVFVLGRAAFLDGCSTL